MDPTSQRAHHALAVVHFFRHELDAFFGEAERALALNPSNASCLGWLGNFLHLAGDERGIPFIRKAMKLDPSHPMWFHSVIAFDHIERAEYEDALTELRKIAPPRPFWAQINLVVTYTELGRHHEAQSAVDDLMRIYPGFTIEKLIVEWRKLHLPDDRIGPWMDGLRKAGIKG
jgi:adenylate cyclase